MPRKRPKTAADQPAYRGPSLSPLDLPEHLEPFFTAIDLRQIVEKRRTSDAEALRDILAEHARRRMINQRCAETLDEWKAKMRPLAPASWSALPDLETATTCRAEPGYRRHRQEDLDSAIRGQARNRELETGLAAVLEGEPEGWHRRELIEIVDRTNAGGTAAQVADQLGIGVRTVERRLAEVRDAALAS